MLDIAHISDIIIKYLERRDMSSISNNHAMEVAVAKAMVILESVVASNPKVSEPTSLSSTYQSSYERYT